MSGGCFGEIRIDLGFGRNVCVVIVVELRNLVFIRNVGRVGRFCFLVGNDRRRWLT